MKPFRWDLKRREQLGNLVEVEPAESYLGYKTDLAECAAKVVARSDNRKLIFVGRSPENLFDYLSGIFDAVDSDKVDLLNISNRRLNVEELRQEYVGAVEALKAHFIALGISPKQLIESSRGVCFCDLVYEGGTYESLFGFIQTWAEEEKYDWAAVMCKIKFLGITIRTKTSPNTWRWQQHAGWVKKHPQIAVQNISVNHSFWAYLGNTQKKVTLSNYPARWGKELPPPRSFATRQALKLAFLIYQRGTEEKVSFARLLSALPEMKQPWLRAMVNELKR